MKMTIATSIESGCRQFRNEEPLSGEPFFYSAWFYVPRYYRAANYWNIFQFKSQAPSRNDAMWVIDLMPRKSGGALHLLLRWKGQLSGPDASHPEPGVKYFDQTSKNVPIGRWFQIEAFLRQASLDTGRLTVWQDGTLLWDLNNIRTKYPGGDQRWSVNNYSDDLQPSPATIYIDDVVISTHAISTADR